ncbi:MAG: hypothetical protein AAF791_09665 [Bacteroidota bacterium]
MLEAYRTVVLDDVTDRDGLGVELRDGDNHLAEAFCDDTTIAFTFTTFGHGLPVALVEEFLTFAKQRLKVAPPQ